MAEPRILLDSALYDGAKLFLDQSDTRHVSLVLRRKPGDTVRVFNAQDGEWRAEIVSVGTKTTGLEVRSLIRPARAAPDLDLLFAPVKRHATDLIIEKATELGVRRIFPVTTQRTIAETVRVDRLTGIAREAAQQTERFDVPEIRDAQSLPRALDGWDASRGLIYADEAGDDANAPWGGESGRALPISEALQSLPQGAAALLIGPEGGFTPEERRMLRAFPFVVPVSLGPRILRAETAVIAALSVIQASWGDWRRA